MAETWAALPVGFLADVCQRIRKYANEGSVRPKYTGSDLYPLAVGVYSRLVRELVATGENAPEIWFTVSVNADDQFYLLPPAVGEVLMVGRLNTTSGLVTTVVDSRSRQCPSGAGVSVSGNMLKFTPKWGNSEDLVVVFTPSGHCFPHLSYVGTGAAEFASKTSLVIDPTPDEGYFDRLPNAYLGCTLRILEAYDSVETAYVPTAYPVFPIQERIITGQTSASGQTTVSWDIDLDFDPAVDNANGYYRYEIVPFGSYQMIEAVACGVAAEIHTLEDRHTMSREMWRMYHSQLRTMRLQLATLLAQKVSLAKQSGYRSRYWAQFASY